MTRTILPSWCLGLEGLLAGSVYACAAGTRVDAAGALVNAGIRVHVDVMVPAEGLPAGVDDNELVELARAVPVDMLDIHLIGSVSGVEQRISTIPRCDHLYVPIGVRPDRPGGTWAVVWDEFDVIPPTPADIDGYDGVLVMLLEPGTSSVADFERLRLVDLFARFCDVGVDGGVTPYSIPHCRSAGATTMVVGRALFPEPALLEGQS